MQFLRCGNFAFWFGMSVISWKGPEERFVRLLKEAFRFFCLFGCAQKIDHEKEQTLPFIPFYLCTIYGRSEGEKKFLIIFLFPSMACYLGIVLNVPLHPFSCDVEVIIGLIFDIYYKETKSSERQKKCVHKLVINNLLYSIAYITPIVRNDLWRSLSNENENAEGKHRLPILKPAQSLIVCRRTRRKSQEFSRQKTWKSLSLSFVASASLFFFLFIRRHSCAASSFINVCKSSWGKSILYGRNGSERLSWMTFKRDSV